MADERKASKWLEFLQVVAMPLTTLAVGFLINASLNTRQQRENNVRLYVEMMARREDADSALRKDMFTSILNAFKEKESKPKTPEYLDEQILNLELLAYNFNESIDLSPLFTHLRKRTGNRTGPPWDDMHKRLERVAREVNERQLTIVSYSGAVVRADAELDQEGDNPANLVLSGPQVVRKNGEEDEIVSRLCVDHADSTGKRRHRQFKMEVIGHDAAAREIRVRLYASRPLTPENCKRPDLDMAAYRDIDTTFSVGMFDFPMIDNTRLSNGERCAVTLTAMTNSHVRLALAYFPGSRASLKDKPYYDEVVPQLLSSPSLSPSREHP